MKYDISVEWTGSFPSLCHGKWMISINKKRLSNLIHEPFDTSGDYQSWRFDNNWNEYCENYYDGLNQTEWIDSVRLFDINNLKQSLTEAGFDVNDDDLMSELYYKIQDKDFRIGSCGGCI